MDISQKDPSRRIIDLSTLEGIQLMMVTLDTTITFKGFNRCRLGVLPEDRQVRVASSRENQASALFTEVYRDSVEMTIDKEIWDAFKKHSARWGISEKLYPLVLNPENSHCINDFTAILALEFALEHRPSSPNNPRSAWQKPRRSHRRPD
jgi:hypothetical protein